MSFSAALYTHIRRHKREYTLAALKSTSKSSKCNTIERQAAVYCTVACTTPHNPPLHCTLLQGPGPLPFHLGVIVTQHQRPHSDQRWPGEGAGVHGWKESGGDIAEGAAGNTVDHCPETTAKKEERGEDGGRENAAR